MRCITSVAETSVPLRSLDDDNEGEDDATNIEEPELDTFEITSDPPIFATENTESIPKKAAVDEQYSKLTLLIFVCFRITHVLYLPWMFA